MLSQIAEIAQGNPFFALELARHAAAGQPLTVTRSVWEAVTARFLDLDESTAAMLRRLAVAGDDIDTTGVLALTGLPEPEAFAMLDAGLAGRRADRLGSPLPLPARAGPAGARGASSAHRRIALHRDATRRLAAVDAEPARIARHWLDGNRPGEAASWLLAAARKAIMLGAFTDALGQLEPLLKHAPGHGEAARLRAEVLDALGDGRAPAAYAAAARLVSRRLTISGRCRRWHGSSSATPAEHCGPSTASPAERPRQALPRSHAQRGGGDRVRRSRPRDDQGRREPPAGAPAPRCRRAG